MMQYIQAMREAEERRWQRDRQMALQSGVVKAGLGLGAGYFNAKAEGDAPAYTGNTMDEAVRRGTERRKKREEREMALRQATYPKLGRA